MLRRSNAKNAWLKQLIINENSHFWTFLPRLFGRLLCAPEMLPSRTPKQGRIVQIARPQFLHFA
jgi:hypothetical protein